jgi:hypothetical protein
MSDNSRASIDLPLAGQLKCMFAHATEMSSTAVTYSIPRYAAVQMRLGF